MRCQYCKNGLSYLGYVKKPRPLQNARLRCVYCGVEFTERKRYRQKNAPWFVPYVYHISQVFLGNMEKLSSMLNVW